MGNISTKYIRDYMRRRRGCESYSEAEEAELRRAQGDRCVICSVKFGPSRLDHDHVTGKVRGLLCGRCNLGLGYFHDNALLIQQALEYLNRFRA